MLFLPPGTSKLQRLHGAFVTEEEVASLVELPARAGGARLRRRRSPVREESEGEERSGAGEDVDEMYDRAVQLMAETRNASISYVQRRLKIGYNRAARIDRADGRPRASWDPRSGPSPARSS